MIKNFKTTDWLRMSLIAAIAIICFLLMIRWTEFQERQATARAENPVVQNQQAPADNDSIPTETSTREAQANGDDNLPTSSLNAPGAGAAAPTVTSHKTVDITTDVLAVTLDLTGGDIVHLGLPTFYAKINTPDEPFELLKNTTNETYVARSGLIGPNATDKSDNTRPQFSTEQKAYRLAEGEDTLLVDLTFQQNQDVTITKRFEFTRGSHLINIHYIVNNNASQPWRAQVYGQIKRNDFNPVISAGIGMSPYLGAATTTNDTHYEKVDFEDMAEKPFKHSKQGGWVAMVQHYFLSAWIPAAEDTNNYELYKSKTSDMYYLQFVSPAFDVAAGSRGEKQFAFYAGPKDVRKLEEISPYLDLTVDYGFLWMIAKPLYFALKFIHNYVGNWGIAIIVLTFLIKLIFFYPSAASYRSMAKMRKVQPKMAELKERHGDNRQKLSQEMMKLYKEEKVNPLGGCLPILIQMPVFIALYWVLMESVELRHAPFFLWIHDLSVKDPYFVLPLIMGATMFLQQKLNPTPPDPMQAKVMQMMPIFFTFLFLVFPAGLVLYWVVNNTLSIIQQYVITKQIEKAP